MPEDSTLSDIAAWIQAHRVYRTFGGPKVPQNPLARLSSARDTEQPEKALSPKLAKAQQIIRQRESRRKAERFFAAIGKLDHFRRLLAKHG